MRVRAVIILEEAAEDLEAGRRFYDEREAGIGRYFIDCLLTDLESLQLHAGIHSVHFGFHRLLSHRFPFRYLLRCDQRIRSSGGDSRHETRPGLDPKGTR